MTDLLTREEEEFLNQVIEETHTDNTVDNTIDNNEELLDEISNAIEEITENSENTETGNNIQYQELPENSPTLLIKENNSRFSSASWFQEVQKQNIIIAGLGGVGSWLSLLISRLNVKRLQMFDPDKVESVNMSGQLYGLSDIGDFKSTGITNIIRNFSNYYRTYSTTTSYTENSDIDNIMMCGFDNMKARKTFFNNWLNGINTRKNKLYAVPKNEFLYIDGRMSAESFQIFCIRGDDDYNIERYKNEFLFSDEEADTEICSYKQTSFCASMIASYMVNLFVNHCANNAGFYRPLPFMTSYDADTMYLKMED